MRRPCRRHASSATSATCARLSISNDSAAAQAVGQVCLGSVSSSKIPYDQHPAPSCFTCLGHRLIVVHNKVEGHRPQVAQAVVVSQRQQRRGGIGQARCEQQSVAAGKGI